MSKSMLDKIREKLQAQATGTQKSSANKDTTTFPFWDMESGSNTTIRFLPDGNNDNILFWVTKQTIKLDFPGIKGGDENKPVSVTVPCIEMYDGPNTCPIQNDLRPMWKDPELEPIARKYWNKKSYIFQGFVQNSTLKEDDAPENPIRKFNINGQLFKVIKSALMDPDFENSPTDYLNGTDFVITKTAQGKWADYSTSKYARRESSLTEAQLEAIDQYGLVDLSTYLPPRPDREHIDAMYEMFEASVNGELYDPERWAKYYKPYGVKVDDQSSSSQTTSSKSTAAPAKVATVSSTVEDDYEDVEVEEVAVTAPVTTAPAGKQSAKDILAALAARKNAG